MTRGEKTEDHREEQEADQKHGRGVEGCDNTHDSRKPNTELSGNTVQQECVYTREQLYQPRLRF